jgi:serine/threonine protein phosphatase 1
MEPLGISATNSKLESSFLRDAVIPTYAVGDVHGCLRQLQLLVERSTHQAGDQKAQFVFLGDYIDRGPDSRGVVEYLMNLQRAQPDRVTCLMGNHEQMLLSAIEGAAHEDNWLENGGAETLRSYRVHDPNRIPRSHVDWLKSLPEFYDDGLRFFVHAGIRPGRALDRQRKLDLLWIREPFLSSIVDHGRLIIHGHTPVSGDHPDIHPNRANLDTGAVFGGPLTAVAFTQEERMPVSIIQAFPCE